MRCLLVSIIFAARLLAQQVAIDQILASAVENERSQKALREQYIYHRHVENFTIKPDGSKGKIYQNVDYDVLFVEGAFYNKLVGRNGKPLGKKETREEEEKLRKTAAQRQAEAATRKVRVVTIEAGNFTVAEIVAGMTHTLSREDMLEGRKAWVIQSEPRAEADASSRQRQLQCYRYTMWIDQEDLVVSRVVFEVVKEGVAPQPGSRADTLFRPLNGVWFATDLDARMITKNGEKRNHWGQIEHFSNHRKFAAISAIEFDGNR